MNCPRIIHKLFIHEKFFAHCFLFIGAQASKARSVAIRVKNHLVRFVSICRIWPVGLPPSHLGHSSKLDGTRFVVGSAPQGALLFLFLRLVSSRDGQKFLFLRVVSRQDAQKFSILRVVAQQVPIFFHFIELSPVRTHFSFHFIELSAVRTHFSFHFFELSADTTHF